MKLKVLFKKLFIGGTWYVGLRVRESTVKKKFGIIEMSEGQWIADPFLYEYEERHFLFVEQYCCAHNRAALGVFEIVDGKAKDNSVIIDQLYHMSYPNVFYYKGEHWMIPESSSNQSLDLYRCTLFPYKWEHVKSLIKGRRVVDTTTYIHNDIIYLLSYEKIIKGWILHVFTLDMVDYSLKLVSDTFYEKNIGRPAGQLYEEDGCLYRPAQNCASKYGESLLIYEITDITPISYCEKFVKEIKRRDINTNIRCERIHTYNRDSQYEVVDLFQEHFDIFHWWKIFKRQYLKM